jgi:V8-like Glu-specific endopeptidase
MSFAQQPPTPGDSEVTRIERREDTRAAQDANKFNTREKRLREKALDWNATKGTPTDTPAIAPTDAAREQPGSAPGGPPDPNADDRARRQFPNEWRALPQRERRGGLNFLDVAPAEDAVQLAGTADVFTQYCENCPLTRTNTTYSWRAAGKLFTNLGPCSASVISGNNIIVTAAHCCWNRRSNNWIGGWSFAPAYHNGAAPYGMFPWTVAAVLTAWVNNGATANDVCVIGLGRNNANQNVTFYTGWLGRSWNWPSVQDHNALGYPDNLGGGQTLQLCTSESFSPNGGCGGNAVLNTGCSMTFGASGGPWVRAYRGGGDWVNSVVSGWTSGCTGTMGSTFNGPRFTSSNIVTLCNSVGC